LTILLLVKAIQIKIIFESSGDIHANI